VNACVPPAAIEALAGVTAIETSVGAVTVSTAVFEVIDPLLAVMFVEPAATPVATPVDAIVATVVLDDAHVTELVMF